MSGKDIEGLLKALFFVFGLCLMVISLIFLPFAIQAHKTREQRQRDAMAAKAKEFGLDFSGEDDQNIAKEFLHIDKLDDLKGSDKHALNVLSGDYGGHSVTLFDFHYATSGVWWWAPSWTIHNYASFVTLNLGKAFPELTIGAEGGGLFRMISDVFGGGDIDFESHEFSERYEVRSNSKKFAYDVCNAQMIDYLLDRPANLIEVDKDTLAIGFDAEHNAARMDSVLSHLLKIRSLMPAYLFEKGHGHPDRVVRQSTSPGAPVVPGSLELNGAIGSSERNSLISDLSSHRWVAYYRGYLLLAALSGVITLMSGLIRSGFMALLSSFTVMAIAKVSLFVFAFYSLSRPNETWTRNLHIAINGAAVIMPLTSLTGIYRYLPFDFLLWLPVPTFHSLVPFSGWVVQLASIALGATWLYFWVQLGRSGKTDPYQS